MTITLGPTEIIGLLVDYGDDVYLALVSCFLIR